MQAFRLGLVLRVCVALALLAPLSRAQEKTSMTVLSKEPMRHLRGMGEPRLSPDGHRVLLRVWDATADGGKSHLWLIDADGGEPRQLTYSPDGDKRGERAGEWLPDGGSVLFLAHRGERTSLFRLPMAGGEAKLLDLKVLPAVDDSKRADAVPPASAEAKSKPPEEKVEPLPIDVQGFRVAPDGRTVAVWAQDPETPGEKRAKEAKADAQRVDHDGHGSRLYLVDLTQATPGTEKVTVVAIPPDVRQCAWSPDAKRLVALADAPNGQGDLEPAMSAWMMDVSDPAHPARMAEMPATVETGTWSGDGGSFYYLAQAKQDAPPGYVDLYRETLATKKTELLSDGFAGTVAAREMVVGVKTGGPWVTVEAGVDGMLARWQAPGRAPELIGLGEDGQPGAVLREAATNASESGWVFLGSGAGRAETLFFRESLRSPARVLRTPAMLPDGVTVGAAAKRVHWRNEGLTIDGLLYLPEGATAERKVPLVVEVHGGPTGAYLDEFDPFAEFLRGRGWAVLRTNPRGSTGRGAAFAAANKNDLGGADFRDIMAGVDAVLKTEPLDGGRMALTGYSYGGEMAGFAEGKTARFRAIVSMAPVIDQQSEYGTERGSFYDRWYFGRPWEHAADAWRQSPLSGVAQAKTPMLLLQGESDATDPLGQAQEMYRALRQQGVPVELVTYPREDHGPLAAGIFGRPSTEPWHGFDARQRIVAFLESAFAAKPR